MNIIRWFLFKIGYILSLIYPYSLSKKVRSVKTVIYTSWIGSQFKSIGAHSAIMPSLRLLLGARYIELGSNVVIGTGSTLTAWDNYKSQKFMPQIIIKDGTCIGDFSHITAVNSIVIGKNVLTGKNILISDNAHGDSTYRSSILSPTHRPLVSKGPVIINDNVWIGEKSSIMPGVTIGEGAIIASNSVVTKNVPPHCLVAGTPARIIKVLS